MYVGESFDSTRMPHGREYMKNGSYNQEAKKLQSKKKKQWRTNKKKKEM